MNVTNNSTRAPTCPGICERWHVSAETYGSPVSIWTPPGWMEGGVSGTLSQEPQSLFLVFQSDLGIPVTQRDLL